MHPPAYLLDLLVRQPPKEHGPAEACSRDGAEVLRSMFLDRFSPFG
jgi:hypothetical protein